MAGNAITVNGVLTKAQHPQATNVSELAGVPAIALRATQRVLLRKKTKEPTMEALEKLLENSLRPAVEGLIIATRNSKTDHENFELFGIAIWANATEFIEAIVETQKLYAERRDLVDERQASELREYLSGRAITMINEYTVVITEAAARIVTNHKTFEQALMLRSTVLIGQLVPLYFEALGVAAETAKAFPLPEAQRRKRTVPRSQVLPNSEFYKPF